MSEPTQLAEDDPRRHTRQVRERLSDLIAHLRQDVTKIDDPRAQALFETTAEALTGLEKAYADFEARDEPAWRD